MFKIIVLYPAPADPEHFKRYYVEHHLPIAAELPGLKSSYYSFDVAAADGPSPYFCIWQGEFENGAAAGAAMQSDAGQRVAADVANYASNGATVLLVPMEKFG